MQIQGRRVFEWDALEEKGDFYWLFRDGQPSTLVLCCPACGCEHAVSIKPFGGPGWEFDGNLEQPTLSPSILFSAGHGNRNPDCRWHGFLRGGVWIFV